MLTDEQPVIVLLGAVYLHAVLAVEPVDAVVYVPPDTLTPDKELHAEQDVLVCALHAIYLPFSHAVQLPV